jgi:hypothetical protein
MKIPKETLDEIIESTNRNFQNYKREQYLSDDEIIEMTHIMYDKQKIIKWLDNIQEVKEKVSTSDKPWVYHHSLNMNWVLFFTSSFRKIHRHLDIGERDELKPIITKIRSLRKIFDHVDGIVENGDFVYLIKADVNFIKMDLRRWNSTLS